MWTAPDTEPKRSQTRVLNPLWETMHSFVAMGASMLETRSPKHHPQPVCARPVTGFYAATAGVACHLCIAAFLKVCWISYAGSTFRWKIPTSAAPGEGCIVADGTCKPSYAKIGILVGRSSSLYAIRSGWGPPDSAWWFAAPLAS